MVDTALRFLPTGRGLACVAFLAVATELVFRIAGFSEGLGVGGNLAQVILWGVVVRIFQGVWRYHARHEAPPARRRQSGDSRVR